MTTLLTFLIVLLLLFIIVVGNELLSRRFKIPHELSRKITHILTGVVVALSAWWLDQLYLVVLSVMFLIVILVSSRLNIFTSIHEKGRGGYGDIWYPIGILLAAILFASPLIFMYAILILAVSDGAAGLFGKYFGRRKIPFISSPKTYLGTGVFIVTAFIVSLTVVSPGVAIVTAVYLALIELFSFKGIDNLLLPLAAGIAATVFG